MTFAFQYCNLLIYDNNGTFFKDGIRNVSLTPVLLPDIFVTPLPITNFLRQYFPNFLVERAFKVTSKTNVVTYEVGVTKGIVHGTLYFSSTGVFLRSENINPRIYTDSKFKFLGYI